MHLGITFSSHHLFLWKFWITFWHLILSMVTMFSIVFIYFIFFQVPRKCLKCFAHHCFSTSQCESYFSCLQFVFKFCYCVFSLPILIHLYCPLSSQSTFILLFQFHRDHVFLHQRRIPEKFLKFFIALIINKFKKVALPLNLHNNVSFPLS